MRQRNIITYEQANYNALVQKLLKFQYANFCGFQYRSWATLCCVVVVQCFTLYINCSSLHEFIESACNEFEIFWEDSYIYRGADKSLARPGREKATTTEDFDVHVSYL